MPGDPGGEGVLGAGFPGAGEEGAGGLGLLGLDGDGTLGVPTRSPGPP